MIGRIFLCILASWRRDAKLPKASRPARTGNELVVVSINGPATWYEDSQGHPAGFEYDLAALFAKELRVPLRGECRRQVAETAEKALAAKRGHLAAALLPRRFDLPGGLAWGPSYRSAQYQLVWRAT